MKAFQHLRIETLPMLVFYQSDGLPRSRPSNEWVLSYYKDRSYPYAWSVAGSQVAHEFLAYGKK
jgi:hypothetical protein